MICLHFKGYLVTKLIKAELFSDIRFRRDITIEEDMLVCVQLVAKAEHMAYMECNLYYYFHNTSSAMSTYRESSWTIQKASQEIFDLFSKKSPENIIFAEYIWIHNDFWMLCLLTKNNALTKEQFEKLMAHMRIHFSKEAFQKFNLAPRVFLRCAEVGRIPFILTYKAYCTTVGRIKGSY